MLLRDETVINYESAGSNTLHCMLNAEFDSASKKYIYRQGDYIIAFNSDDIMSEHQTIALNEQGRVVETTYKTLMSGETKEHKLLGDDELQSRMRYIKLDTPVPDGGLWEDHISDPYDWDFVRFILKHRLDLMI